MPKSFFEYSNLRREDSRLPQSGEKDQVEGRLTQTVPDGRQLSGEKSMLFELLQFLIKPYQVLSKVRVQFGEFMLKSLLDF